MVLVGFARPGRVIEPAGWISTEQNPQEGAILPTPEGTIVALTYAQHLVED